MLSRGLRFIIISMILSIIMIQFLALALNEPRFEFSILGRNRLSKTGNLGVGKMRIKSSDFINTYLKYLHKIIKIILKFYFLSRFTDYSHLKKDKGLKKI